MKTGMKPLGTVRRALDKQPFLEMISETWVLGDGVLL
jgi:hypothetical protein